MKRKIVLEDDIIRLKFDGGGGLASITDLRTGAKLAGRKKVNPLWCLYFRDGGGKIRKVPSTRARLVETRTRGRNLFLEWRLAALGTTVSAAVRLVGTAIPEWRISVSNASGMALWEVRYPIFGGLGPLGGNGSKDRLVVPWQFGIEVDDPLRFLKKGGASTVSYISEFGRQEQEPGVSSVAFSYPGMWSLQFMAIYNPLTCGLYLGAHDGEARFKRFGLYRDTKDTMSAVMCNFPEERIKKNLDYTLPYPIFMGLFEGNWWSAAQYYRKWAVRQRWCRYGPVKDRKDIPKWLKENDFWYWNWRSQQRQGMPELMAPAVVELKKRLGCNVAVHWYASHCEPFNQRIPELFPIAPSFEKKLKIGLRMMHKNGIHAIPYMNPRMCDPNTETWEKHDVKTMACRTEKGELHVEEYLTGLKWITICPTVKKWHRIIYDIVKGCLDRGYDGVYLDQVSSCYTVPCFAAGHGHPRGGGNTWYKGYLAMMELIRKKAAAVNKNAAFTSESTVECFNDVFDANLARMVSRVQDSQLGCDNSFPIPLCNSIYHDYVITYGSAIDLAHDTPDTVYLGGALNLTSGNQLMFESYTLSDIARKRHEEYLAYFRNLCRFRKRYRNYFNFGEWAEPVEIETKTVVLNLSRQRPAYKQPAVLTATWKLKKKLHVFVNHTAEDQKIVAVIEGRRRKLTVPARDVIGVEV